VEQKQNKTLLRHIPNFITSLNLLSGSLAVILLANGNTEYGMIAGYLVFVAAIFDFLDGLTARALHAYSDMGKELDSLADLISFGLVPGLIAFNILKDSLFIIDTPILEIEYSEMLILLIAMLIPVFSGLRLAKFNVDTRQSVNFIGLPTPANAIFWASLIIMHNNLIFHTFICNNIEFIIGSIIVLSFLLVSEIPMFSLKVKNFSIKDNLIRYIFLGISLILLTVILIYGYPIIIAFPIIIINYIFTSIIDAIFKKLKKN